jgi:hypothetical protein
LLLDGAKREEIAFWWLIFAVSLLFLPLSPEKGRTYPHAGRNDLPARAHINKFVLANKAYNR